MYATRADVKLAMEWSSVETGSDELIDQYLSGAEAQVNKPLERGLLEDTYIDYLDGGRDVLSVELVPIILVTSIHEDVAHDFGSGTLVAAADYFIPDKEAGEIMRKVGVWLPGRKSNKVTYSSGYTEAPAEIRDLVMEMVVTKLRRKSSPDVQETSHRDGRIVRTDWSAWDRKILRVVERYL